MSELLVALSGSPIPTYLFQTLADNVSAAVTADCVAVCLLDPDGQGYRVHSLSDVPLPAGPFQLAEGLPGRAMQAGRVTTVDDLGTGDALEAACLDQGLKAALVAPLRRGPEVLGALLFAARPPAVYDEDDEQIAALIGAGLSAALETSRAYQALADERGTMGAVLGSTQDAILVVNTDGMVLLANPAVQDMLGLASEGLAGRPLADVLDHRALLKLFESGRPGAARVTLSDGRVALASLVEVVTAYGEAVGLAAVLRDITLLEQLEQMKKEFVAAVSHDLKAPIMVMSATAQLIVREAGPDDERLRARADRIIRTAEQMSALVVDLLDLGKLESGLEVPTDSIDLVTLIEHAVAFARPLAEPRDIAVETRLPRSATVVAVPGRLTQVLANLVGNAVKYTGDGGRVCVSLAIAEGGVTVEVADTGIGIPPADLPRVFEKFYRVKNAATEGIPGTGLGLAITRRIVETHGGRIWAESTPGQGSTFAFSLPLLPA